MPEVSTFRLYVLRAAYLLIAGGLAIMVWPKLLSHTNEWALKYGDTVSLLAGVQLLSILGIRYPLKMLPVLMFELVWKTVWLLTIALPLWRADQIDARTAESVEACVFGVVVCLVAIPWHYAYRHYVRAPGERWKAA
jgi:hypothetical protein